MSIKNTTLSLFILLSVQVFSQENVENTISDKFETKISYLDSIKKTFVNNELASRVDSLWMKELTSLDLYNTITGDIEKVNIDAAVDYELPTELLKERLAAMDAKSPFNIEYNQGLENIIKSFLKNRKKSFERLMGVSEYYFPLFEEALAKQNVPLEIKYLAVVESALNPRAVSKMGATGLWQFMYHTGKQYGLKIDSYIDERSDPLKSSEAATKYMTNMYKMFGDWDLVLASYNSGPGNVSKAIRRSGGQKNYWNIRKNLPKETQGYVPAFLATMYLYEYHKEHGIVPQRATVQHFATDTIMIKQQLSFKQIGDLLDVPVAQLQLLNPSYKLNVVPFYKDQNHFLRLPQEKIAVFASNESQIYAYAEHELNKRERPFESTRALAIKDSASPSAKSSNGSKTTYYTVKRGDNLSSLADKYDVSAFQIKKWNNLKSNTIAYGKSLKIITGGNEAKSLKKESIIDTVPSQIISKNQSIVAKTAKEETTLTRGVAAKENAFTYLVQKGDNLYTIAQKYNVTIAELQEWNNISNDNLQYGALLQIASKELESKEEIAVVQERKDIEYVVQKGDKLNAIATKFGSSLADLRLWNKLADNKISIGKTLVVAKDEVAIVTEKADVSSFKTKSTVASSSKKSAAEYSVKKGDSLFSIAKKYPGVTISDLKKWNDIRNEDIQPGMKLKING
ncbi:LysM peptidoglycan-binding domain-containing protein [Flavobacterium galactosidilyticum]|uniref:LysM peptidoglycan-binding domain-containing protein n=1 Tax=Flavobacterium galactosidilyticum TaxID=2893886 RepID=UPI001E4DDCAA|nr:LysM peptidoglycan-binding domain-containing protein [Flavobacterium sp. F-340]UFH47208.1 LysM peptidoglycan-binding domain-containing protein [Flavobacterium sp. F-340]